MKSIPIFQVERAAAMPDVEMRGEMLKLCDNDEYKYLSAFPAGKAEDGADLWFPMCSKDTKEWVMCFGAVIDGEQIDLRGFADEIQHICEETTP